MRIGWRREQRRQERSGGCLRLAGMLLAAAGVLIPMPAMVEGAAADTLASAADPADPAGGRKAVDVEVRGRVLDLASREGVPGAAVHVREWRTVCDAEGRFALTVPEGRWVLEAAASQYQPGTTLAVDACAGCRPEVEILLLPERFFREEVTVSASATSSDLVATTPVRPTEVLEVAGAFENIFRVLQTLPGVAGTGEFSSRLSVRGGGPDQNVTLMDGIEIHDPYRLYGLVSAFNPETVEGFELSTGAFSAQYGDRLSSVLSISNRNGRQHTAATGSVGLSLTDGNAIAEGRLPGARGSWLLTGRRTWYDLVAGRFTEDDLPAFEDLQARVAVDLGAGRSLTFTGLRSRERANLTFTEDFESGVMNTKNANDLVGASLFLPLGDRGSWRTIAGLYDHGETLELDASYRNEGRRSNAPYDDLGFVNDEVAGTLGREVRDRSLRQELLVRPFGRHLLGAGFELHSLDTRERLRIDQQRRPEEGLYRLDLDYDARNDYRRFGAWILDRFPVGSRIDVEAGLRFDQSRLNRAGTWQPRLSLSARLTPATRLKAAYGLHAQTPGYDKLFQADFPLDLSDPLRLKDERARHLVIGLERELAPGTTARIEGFHKSFSNLLIGRLETAAEVEERLAPYDFPADLAASVPSQPMITSDPVNDGGGRAWGFDAFLARRQTSSATRLSGWLAYTFTVADRQAYGLSYPFDYEQRHALSAVATWRAHQRLELSATGRFATGRPRTAPLGLYVAGVQDLDDGDGDGLSEEIVPERDSEGRLVYGVDYGGVANLNRSRLPWYGRVDLRATFVPRWGKGRWRLYVDLINVLGRDNGVPSDLLEHDPTGTQPRIVSEPENGFPFLPSFGVHVRF